MSDQSDFWTDQYPDKKIPNFVTPKFLCFNVILKLILKYLSCRNGILIKLLELDVGFIA